MSYGGEYDIPLDYITTRVDEAVTNFEQATAASGLTAVGSTDGQIAIWVSPNFVAGSLTSGDGIGFAYSSSPSPSVAVGVTSASALRTKLEINIKAITTGTATVDPASIAANSGGTVDVTITGVATDDTIIFNPPALTAGLLYVGCRAQSANTARIFLYNATGGAIDEASASWRYTWIDAS